MNYTVILEPKQWGECWREMCKDLGYVPAWYDYPKYFGCISCDTSDHQIHGHDLGFVIVFKEATDAMAFKLKYS